MKRGNVGEKQSDEERIWHKESRCIEPKIWEDRITHIIGTKEHTIDAIMSACCIIRWDMFGEMIATTCPQELKSLTNTFSFVATPSDESISLVLQAAGYPKSIADKRSRSEKILHRKRDNEKQHYISAEDAADLSGIDMDL